jgi:repressor LexA
MARELTEKQKRVLTTLEAYWSEHQVPPSIADVAKELGINKATAYEHLLALRKKGFLVHQARAGRTWRLVQHSKKALCAHFQVPVLGRVSAGAPILAAENIEEHIVCEHANTNNELFALKVQGHSMIKAHIQNNDLVIADRSASIRNNDIVVALIDGEEATVKRYEKRGEIICLIPENDEFRTLELEPTRVSILGKVIEVRRFINS